MRASVSTGRSDLVSANSTNLVLPSPASSDRRLLDRRRRRPSRRRRRPCARTETTRGAPSTLTVANSVAGVHRPLEGAVASTMPVMSRRHAGAEARGDARQQVLAERGGGGDDDVDALLLDDVADRRRVGVGDVVLERRDRRPRRRRRRSRRARSRAPSMPLPEDRGDDLAARLGGELLAGGDADQRGLRELSVQMLGEDENVAHDRCPFVQMTLASSCRTFTSSCTEPTLRPAGALRRRLELDDLHLGRDVDAEVGRPGSPSAPSCAPS